MRSLRLAPFAALLVLAQVSPIASAGVRGTAHDFRNSAAYPHLASMTVTSVCAGCHTRASASGDFGNDFLGGIAVVTDPSYGRANPSLPVAMACLGCHDGTIRTPLGVEYLPTPAAGMSGPDLNWSHGGAHNIWGMGNEEAYHPVEIHYPPLESEKIWPGFTTLPIAGDNNIQTDSGGHMWIVDSGTTVRLPLVTDPNDPAKGIISCTTCHNTHDDSQDTNFKRLGWPDLCFMCHRQM